MKVEVKQDGGEFKLIITIESEDELESLWHRFNVSNIIVAENSSDFRVGKPRHVINDYVVYAALSEMRGGKRMNKKKKLKSKIKELKARITELEWQCDSTRWGV